MTRQRKTHLAILALVPLVVFAAVRCADSTGAGPAAVQSSRPVTNAGVAATLAKLHQKNDWVGQFHNDALGYVLVALNKIPAKGRDRLNVCETARRAYREFHKNRRGTDVPRLVDDAFEQFCSRGPVRMGSASVALAATDAGRRSDVSYEAQGFIDQFLGAIDASVSYEDLSARINAINAAAATSLSAEDAEAVVTVGTIALSSADYWANNLPAWDPFVGGGTGFFTRLSASRTAASPFVPGAPGAYSWGSIWNDTKAAAKRAARGDVSAAAKAVISAGFMVAVGGPATYEAVLAASATGSVMAVLGF